MWAPRYWAVVYWTGSYWNPGGAAVPAVKPRDTHDGKGGKRLRRKPQVQLQPPPDFRLREGITRERKRIKAELLAKLRPVRDLEPEAAAEDIAQALELAILRDIGQAIDFQRLVDQLQAAERQLAELDLARRRRRDEEAIMVLVMAA